jgi:hypothetical protein
VKIPVTSFAAYPERFVIRGVGVSQVTRHLVAHPKVLQRKSQVRPILLSAVNVRRSLVTGNRIRRLSQALGGEPDLKQHFGLRTYVPRRFPMR